jgi:hypothetical protein
VVVTQLKSMTQGGESQIQLLVVWPQLWLRWQQRRWCLFVVESARLCLHSTGHLLLRRSGGLRGSAHQPLDCAGVDASDPPSQVRMNGGGLDEASGHACAVVAVVFVVCASSQWILLAYLSGENKHVGAISK